MVPADPRHEVRAGLDGGEDMRIDPDTGMFLEVARPWEEYKPLVSTVTSFTTLRRLVSRSNMMLRLGGTLTDEPLVATPTILVITLLESKTLDLRGDTSRREKERTTRSTEKWRLRVEVNDGYRRDSYI
ncbi:hypothetical protein GNI_056160 [Gregarina niphandrodes]|uniref:Uncharacterized protein n=1 Tax=Gregarina niphandrodes TaxID=110365 RepID=A0A023B8T9_GRENI|nr:hypothetical protein GNI_056160 [Gregarina niphandrodes]EZG70293.1 hypothetical protein GNI_056160 [Gregarina niphandrodes]|eukprot:XP_011129955.1 hypothetical protein GNI_056160 [Gregarina niphandrodes]